MERRTVRNGDEGRWGEQHSMGYTDNFSYREGAFDLLIMERREETQANRKNGSSNKG